jgi:putative tryptophan/tyrosine transport system substrate-binding protein
MRRRELISLLGGATAWPPAVRARQPAVPVPVIGLPHSGAPEESTSRIASFRQGLGDRGYEEDRNLAIDYRWAAFNTAQGLVQQEAACLLCFRFTRVLC